MRFYSEMIVVTVLSLLASSLWIEYTKGFIARHFHNDLSALFISALLMSLLAICFLHILFSDLPTKEEGYTPEKLEA